MAESARLSAIFANRNSRDRSTSPQSIEGVPPVPSTTDADLVAQLRTGDLRALGVLYARYGADVRRLALRLDPQRGEPAADDICQTVFLTFLDTLARYTESGHLRAWLLGITSKHCRSTRRRWWTRLRLVERWGAGAGVALAYAPVDARLEARQTIEQALAALPEAQREVLVLHHLEGLGIPEVALALGVSENAVSTRLYRARRAMEAAQ